MRRIAGRISGSPSACLRVVALAGPIFREPVNGYHFLRFPLFESAGGYADGTEARYPWCISQRRVASPVTPRGEHGVWPHRAGPRATGLPPGNRSLCRSFADGVFNFSIYFHQGGVSYRETKHAFTQKTDSASGIQLLRERHGGCRIVRAMPEAITISIDHYYRSNRIVPIMIDAKQLRTALLVRFTASKAGRVHKRPIPDV